MHVLTGHGHCWWCSVRYFLGWFVQRPVQKGKKMPGPMGDNKQTLMSQYVCLLCFPPVLTCVSSKLLLCSSLRLGRRNLPYPLDRLTGVHPKLHAILPLFSELQHELWCGFIQCAWPVSVDHRVLFRGGAQAGLWGMHWHCCV